MTRRRSGEPVSKDFGVALCVVVLTTLLPAPPVSAAGPEMTGLFPLALPIGGSVELTVTGKNLDDLLGLAFARDGFEVKKVAKDRLLVTIARDVPPGPIDAWVVTAAGVSNPRSVVVVSGTAVVAAEPKEDPGQPTVVPLPGVVSARLDRAADIDTFRFSGTRDQQVSIHIRSRSLDGSVRPAVAVIGPTGRELAHSAPHADEPRLTLRLPADGVYRIRISDQAYLQDAAGVYLLSLETGPCLETAFPSAITRGRAARLRLWGHGLPGSARPAGRTLDVFPDPVLVIPPAGVQGAWPVRRPGSTLLDTFRLAMPGWAGGAWMVLSDEPVVPETIEPNEVRGQAQPVVVPGRVCGRFVTRGDVDWYAFKARKGQPLEIIGVGTRLGQVMDLQLIVHDMGGKAVTTVAAGTAPKGLPDRLGWSVGDPAATWTPPADGTWLLAAHDVYGGSLAGPGRSYQVIIRPPRAEFHVWVLPPDEKSSTGLSLPAGGRGSLEVAVVRGGGWKGPVSIRADSLPDGVSAEPVEIPAGKLTAKIELVAAADAPAAVGEVHLVAEATIGKRKRRRRVVPTAVIPGPSPVTRVVDALVLVVTGK